MPASLQVGRSLSVMSSSSLFAEQQDPQGSCSSCIRSTPTTLPVKGRFLVGTNLKPAFYLYPEATWCKVGWATRDSVCKPQSIRGFYRSSSKLTQVPSHPALHCRSGRHSHSHLEHKLQTQRQLHDQEPWVPRELKVPLEAKNSQPRRAEEVWKQQRADSH